MLEKKIFTIRQNGKYDRQRGFTLVETIVSIGLLTLVLGAFVSSVTTSLKLTDLGNKRYLASKIAQEGIELFQSKRNNNVICIQNDATTPCDAIPSNDDGEKDWRFRLYERTLGNKDLPPKNPWRINEYEIDGNNPNSLLAGFPLSDYNSTHYLCQQSALSDRFNYCGVPAQYIPGKFTREIRVTPDSTMGNPAPIFSPLKVEVIVSWNNRSGARQSLSLVKRIFDTQP